jgi:uncharacterized phiE125 gp8 family phage protein
MLRELEPAPRAAVPLAEFAAHLRLPEGFGGESEATLDLYARAATAAVEGMTGLALISRRFRWTVTRWRDPERVAPPIRPVERIDAVTLIGPDGGWSAADPGEVRLIPDAFRPLLAGAGGRSLPRIPTEGRAEVELTAGFGADWNAVPEDLRQAVLMLGAHYHEQRHVTADPEKATPFGVRALLARWREPRL